MNTLPPPTYEPISLELARAQCRIDVAGTPDDLLLEDIYIPAAREYAEHYTGQAIGGRALELALTEFPAAIQFPVGPVLGVVSIAYLDADGIEQLVPAADYVLDPPLSSHTAVLRTVILADESEWPDTNGATNNIRVTYAVGYSAPGESPEDLPLPRAFKVAMLLIIGHLNKNRDATVQAAIATLPLGVNAFLDTAKRSLGFA